MKTKRILFVLALLASSQGARSPKIPETRGHEGTSDCQCPRRAAAEQLARSPGPRFVRSRLNDLALPLAVPAQHG